MKRQNLGRLALTLGLSMAANTTIANPAVFQAAAAVYAAYEQNRRDAKELANFASLSDQIAHSTTTILTRFNTGDFSTARTSLGSAQAFLPAWILNPRSTDRYLLYHNINHSFGKMSDIMNARVPASYDERVAALNMLTLLGPWLLVAKSIDNDQGFKNTATMIINDLEKSFQWDYVYPCYITGIFGEALNQVWILETRAVQINPTCIPTSRNSCMVEIACRSRTFNKYYRAAGRSTPLRFPDPRPEIAAYTEQMPGAAEVRAMVATIRRIRG